MKMYLSLILFGICLSGYSQSTKTAIHYRTVKTIFSNLDDDNKTDTITLNSSLKDPSSFNKISIKLSSGNRKTFIAKDSWTIVDNWFLDSNKNSVNSKLLFLKKTDKHAVILLFGGLDGAGYRREFSMINIEKNKIRMCFDHTGNGIYDVEVPTSLVDLQHNGRLCFVYQGIHEFDGYSNKSAEKLGKPDIGSYTPYFVFPVMDTCKLNKPLTKKYNEDHYVFAGFNYSEKISVLYPSDKNAKPRIWKK
ncbi:MAG TPA: hypothetical protein VFE54_04955 [Mucilaginibacter sp.]|nr:hypothetical protein [Mucilaginibacter sp.]